MNRRFLNLIVHDFSSRMYSLCRIDSSKHLFYSSAAEAAKAAKKNKRGGLPTLESWESLPKPKIKFQASPSFENRSIIFLFSLLGENSILFVDNCRQTALYNTDLGTVAPIPYTNSWKGPNPICLSMTQADPIDPIEPRSLYVMDLSSHAEISTCFEVLSCRKNMDWCWHTLPPPPFVCDPAYQRTINMYSYTVVDGSTICISSMVEGIGTYTFDTVSCVWRQAGNWLLPFYGKAEYVPELKLWFGFSACNPSSSLCALDLSAMDSERPPMLQHTWDYLDLPEELSPSQLHLVNLGSGKFCIATFFGTVMRTFMSPYYPDDDMIEMEFAVLTGVEVVRCDDGKAPLRMIKHKSKGYRFGSHNLECLL